MNYQMNPAYVVRTVHLYGKLRKLCNGDKKVDLLGSNTKMLVSALCHRYGNHLKQFIAQNNWQIFTGKKENRSLSEQEVELGLGKETDVHFYPVVEGSGKAGAIILGIILIVVGVVFQQYYLIGPGVGLILQGLFAPAAASNNLKDKPDERASFIFNGPVNSMEQGGPVSLVYGRFRCGSTVVSAGINAEQLTNYTSPIGT